MRVLADNKALGSTISALHTDLNYPESNLKHEWLKKIWRSTANSDTLTFLFSSDQEIDCIYVGFTNATAITARMYSVTDTLLSTKVILASTNGTAFTTVSGVRYIEIALAASSPVVMGNVGTGKTYTMPDPMNGVVKGFADNTKVMVSDDGQVLMNKKNWLRSVPLKFTVIDLDQYNTIYALLADIDRPIWVDVYEETKNFINPIYGVVTMGKPSQSWKKWVFNIDVLEAR